MSLRKPLLESGLLVLTVLAVAAVLETSGGVRSLAAILLVFVLPGRAFLAAWFPHRLADAPGNILLTFTLSIATAVIGGLALNLLPQGLQMQTWALWLGGITVFNGTVALLRSTRHAETVAPGTGSAIRPVQAVMILIAGVLVLGAIMVARNGALNQIRPGFTQLWILESDSPDNAQIGIQNEEDAPMSYWLIVRQGTTPIQAYYDIHIDAAGTWNTSVPLPSNAASIDQPIDAELYRTDQPNSIYRSVHLWLSEGKPK